MVNKKTPRAPAKPVATSSNVQPTVSPVTPRTQEDVSSWSDNQVKDWITQLKLKKYALFICIKHMKTLGLFSFVLLPEGLTRPILNKMSRWPTKLRTVSVHTFIHIDIFITHAQCFFAA